MAAYEKLRSQVLAGASAGSPVGWGLLVREGIAAWMARSAATLAPIRPAADPSRLGVPWQLPDEVQGGVVRVLASMALAGRGEVSS
ncbi:MAG: hypothetical protein ACREVR_18515 [Burkholderiales bacterium]